MARMNFWLNKNEKNQPTLGTWVTIPSPLNCEIMGHAGLDFQILDLEHGTFSLEVLGDCIRACELANCSPLVRIPNLENSSLIQNVLDLGVHGIVVPQIIDSQCVEKAMKFIHYPPLGQRGFNPFIRGEGFTDSSQKLQRVGLSVILETPTAYADLDNILKLEGLDMIYLGVYDMSVHLGSPGDFSSPKMKEFIETSAKKIASSDKTLGLMVKTNEELAQAKELSAKCLVYGVDTFILSQPIKNMAVQL